VAPKFKPNNFCMFNPKRWERFSPQAVYKKEISARIPDISPVDTVRFFMCENDNMYFHIAACILFCEG